MDLCYLPAAADGVAVVGLPVFVVGFVDDVAAYFDCWSIVATGIKDNKYK